MLRMKNCFEDHGLAISSTVATTGAAPVACGISVLGSGRGEGTSICGCGSADLMSERLGRSAQRAPRKATISTAKIPIASLMVGPIGLRGLARGTVTPGICGISVLKRFDGGRSDVGWSDGGRSDGGCSGISL